MDCKHKMDPVRWVCRICGMTKYNILVNQSPEAVRLLHEAADEPIRGCQHEFDTNAKACRLCGMTVRDILLMKINPPAGYSEAIARIAEDFAKQEELRSARLNDPKPDHVIPRKD